MLMRRPPRGLRVVWRFRTCVNINLRRSIPIGSSADRSGQDPCVAERNASNGPGPRGRSRLVHCESLRILQPHKSPSRGGCRSQNRRSVDGVPGHMLPGPLRYMVSNLITTAHGHKSRPVRTSAAGAFRTGWLKRDCSNAVSINNKYCDQLSSGPVWVWATSFRSENERSMSNCRLTKKFSDAANCCGGLI